MTSRRAIAAAVSIACLWSAAAVAQQTERERRATDPGTGSIEGRIAAFGNRPIAHATIILRTVESRRIGETTSDSDGHFTFKNLRSGGYRVLTPVSSHEVYLGSVFVNVARVASETFVKGNVLIGRVVDERGQPFVGVPVCALQSGSNRASVFTVITDQEQAISGLDGSFVIHHRSASEGRYLVAATPDGCSEVVTRPPDRLAVLPRTFYPSTVDPAAAEEIDAAPDRDRTDLVVRIARAPVSRIDGRLLGYVNDTVVPSFVILEPAPGRVSIVRTAKVTPEGRFTFYGLPRGTYTFIVPPQPAKTTPQMYAMSTLEVDGRPVIPFGMGMKPASWIAGAITFDGREQPFFGVRTYSAVTAKPHYPRADVNRLLSSAYSLIDRRSRFSITGLLPTDYTITTQGFETLGWIPLEAIATRTPGGLPLPDAFTVPLTLNPGEGIFEMQVKFTAYASGVAGVVRDADGVPVMRAMVLVFPADEGRTFADGRPWRTVATTDAGTFEVTPLTAGDYLIVARSNMSRADPEQLAAMRAVATRVAVRPAEKTQLTLTVR